MFRAISISGSRAALVLVAMLVAPVLADARPLDPPVNEWGLPVRDALGQPIIYSREEIEARTLGSIARSADPVDVGLPPSGVTARWGYAGSGSGIGLSNIVLSDGEVITGGSTTTFGPNDYFYVLRPLGGAYEQVFVSRSFPGLVGLGVADVTGDARKEIVAARSNGNVVLFDQRSREELATLVIAASGVAGMTLRDLDGDGKEEILLTTSSTLYVLSGTGSILWQLSGAGGVDVTVGNMDADASLEIATTSGAVADWATRTMQWQRPQGFGIDVEVGDIDGDGMQELIAAQAWDFVWAFDVDTQLPKWSLPMFNTDAIWVGNADADPDLELIVGQAQDGKLRAFNTVTLVEEWSLDYPESGTTFVAIGDPNGDGIRDLVWGSGASSTGEDRLYVADLPTRTIDWQSVQLEGPFVAPQRGDVDGDGLPEIVTASWESDSGYDSGRIVVLDGATLRVRAISPPIVGNFAFEGVHDLRLRNVDADAQLEIVVAADRLYDGVIEIYDFAPSNAFTLKWTNATRPSGAPFYSVDVADVDADGVLEVVGGVGKAHTGSIGTFVYVYSFATGAEEWHTFALTTSWSPISGLAVLTAGGGVADIIAMVNGESFNYFTGTGQIQAIVNGPFGFLGPDASTSARSFLTGDAGGAVRQYQRQGTGYVVAWTRDLGTASVEGVSFLPNGEMAVASTGRLSLYPQRDAPTVAWTSEDYGVRGATLVGSGSTRRPFVGARYAVVSLAPWRTLFDVQPPSGPSSGGTLLTAFGTAFDPAAQMFVGGQPAAGVQVPDPTHATGTTPPLVSCSLNTVTVINPDMSYELLENAFRAMRPGNDWNRCASYQAAVLAGVGSIDGGSR